MTRIRPWQSYGDKECAHKPVIWKHSLLVTAKKHSQGDHQKMGRRKSQEDIWPIARYDQFNIKYMSKRNQMFLNDPSFPQTFTQIKTYEIWEYNHIKQMIQFLVLYNYWKVSSCVSPSSVFTFLSGYRKTLDLWVERICARRQPNNTFKQDFRYKARTKNKY